MTGWPKRREGLAGEREGENPHRGVTGKTASPLRPRVGRLRQVKGRRSLEDLYDDFLVGGGQDLTGSQRAIAHDLGTFVEADPRSPAHMDKTAGEVLDVAPVKIAHDRAPGSSSKRASAAASRSSCSSRSRRRERE